MNRQILNSGAALAFTLALSNCAPTQKAEVEESAAPPPSTAVRNDDPLYSPNTEADYPTNVYWGDTHLHTNFSMDAFTFGTVLGPEDAYRFARGETVMATHGQPARLSRPLDFLVIADHSDGLGAMLALQRGDPILMQDETMREWRKELGSAERSERGKHEGIQTVARNPAILDNDEVRGSAWNYISKTADKFYQPGVFTPLIGFEYSLVRGGQNLHRVVVYRDDATKAGAFVPLSAKAEGRPEKLWDFLGRYEQETGGKALAIPHNGNISNGAMFPLAEREFGDPMDKAYLDARARWEPVVEVTQIKGDGETHPFLSVDDEFADYETWALGDFAGVPKTNDMLAGEYAREALKRGLALDRQFGTNPYQFGMIGSTDSHTGLAAVEENNFFGKHSAGMEPTPTRWKEAVGGRGDAIIPGWMMASSGYAAVWAKANTREEIWDALARREVYATTGPRMTVRFFGGWAFSESDAAAPDIARAGYAGGAPMGGEISGAENGPPKFLVSVLKDPDGANLDRIQIVKGWIDADGATHERVFDVAWSGERTPGDDGKLPPVGSTVDVDNATYSNSIGAPELKIVWTDPEFDPKVKAFYYVRALEIPTPRWTAYDRKRFGLEMGKRVPMITQERAYSSPIWYSPNG